MATVLRSRFSYHRRLFLLLLAFSWALVACFVTFQYSREKRFKAERLDARLQLFNLRLLDAVLTPRGHRVLTAPSGAEGLALLETEDVDLVLLDIVMPEMDGYEVCRRIRSRAATEFLPVVMITASGSDQRLAALAARRDDITTQLTHLSGVIEALAVPEPVGAAALPSDNSSSTLPSKSQGHS